MLGFIAVSSSCNLDHEKAMATEVWVLLFLTDLRVFERRTRRQKMTYLLRMSDIDVKLTSPNLMSAL